MTTPKAIHVKNIFTAIDIIMPGLRICLGLSNRLKSVLGKRSSDRTICVWRAKDKINRKNAKTLFVILSKLYEYI